MVRISDARMSGTSYGACILHVAPESYVGGPLSLLETGDIIEIDVNLRSINMLVDDKTLLHRKKKVKKTNQKLGEVGCGCIVIMFDKQMRVVILIFWKVILERLQKNLIFFREEPCYQMK